eukprot:5186219-Prymnesium_polylepis.3
MTAHKAPPGAGSEKQSRYRENLVGSVQSRGGRVLCASRRKQTCGATYYDPNRAQLLRVVDRRRRQRHVRRPGGGSARLDLYATSLSHRFTTARQRKTCARQ